VSTETRRQFSSGVRSFHRDHAGTGGDRREHCRHPHPAYSVHHHGVPRPGLQDIEYCPGTGLHAAPERSCDSEVDIPIDDDGVVLTGQRELGETRLSEESVEHRSTRARDAGRAVRACTELVQGVAIDAVSGSALPAIAAQTAVPERQHHVVAGIDSADGPADRLDHARALVPEQYRPLGRTCPSRNEIGMTDPRGFHPNQDLVLAGFVDVDVLDGEGLGRITREQRPRSAHQSRSNTK